MAKTSTRDRLIERAIRATADHLGQELSPAEVRAIRLACRGERGRPPRQGFSPHELLALERMSELLATGTARSKTAAARQVASELPGARTELAAYHWLRRSYATYAGETVARKAPTTKRAEADEEKPEAGDDGAFVWL